MQYDSQRPAARRPASTPNTVQSGGAVKWFNPTKGFGFVTLDDGRDAFLHGSVLAPYAPDAAVEGARISCMVGQGIKGLQVFEVVTLDAPTESARSRRPTRAELKPIGEAEGEVKWFDASKGFGFVVADSGGKDIFLHMSALQASGIAIVEPGQRLRMTLVAGGKGPQAERVAIL